MNVVMFVMISKPHPRKGTETRVIDDGIQSLTSFQNHIPVRGRKRLAERDRVLDTEGISKPHPRKGTETDVVPESIVLIILNFKTTSP